MTTDGEMRLQIFDVEHGACAILCHHVGNNAGRLAMIDCGSSNDWNPSSHIIRGLGRNRIDYLFITNADQDHMSNLQGLCDSGISVQTFFRNSSYTGLQMQTIKRQSGPLTVDAQRYVSMCNDYSYPVTEPFDGYMGGITVTTFCNAYPTFKDTNNLSLVVFIKYNNFKILFPGDLEKAGWLALLNRPDFCSELIGTNILVASHHGRESGYCSEIFDNFKPDAVIISDKPIEHETQRMVPNYRNVVRGFRSYCCDHR